MKNKFTRVIALSSALLLFGITVKAQGPYYPISGAGDLSQLSQWTPNSNGSPGTPPSAFTSGTFYIQNNTNNNGNLTIANNWTVTGAKIVIGGGTYANAFTVPSAYTITGTAPALDSIKANGTLLIKNAATITDFPMTSTIFNTTSTVWLYNLGSLTGGLPNATTNPFGNLILDSTIYNPSLAKDTLTVAGNFTLEGGATGGLDTAASPSYAATHTVNPTDKIYMELKGTANQIITGNGCKFYPYNFIDTFKTAGNVTFASNTPMFVFNALYVKAITASQLTRHPSQGGTQSSYSSSFNDGGNTFICNGNIGLGGLDSDYTLTGTILFYGSVSNDPCKIEDCQNTKGYVIPALNNVIIDNSFSEVYFRDETNLDGAKITINGNLTIEAFSVSEGGMLMSSAGYDTLQINGNYTNTYTVSPTYSLTTIKLGGSAAQTLQTAVSGGETFKNLEIDNTSASGVTLSSSFSVSDSLALTKGNFILGTNNLTTLTGVTITGGSSSSYVATNSTGVLKETYSAAGTYNFPVGDNAANTDYTPMSLTFTAGSSGGTVSVLTNDVKESNNHSTSNYLNRYWTISQSGLGAFNCSLLGTYLPGDVVGTEADITTGIWKGAEPWVQYNPVSVVNHQVSGSSVTAFGDVSGLSDFASATASVPCSVDAITTGDASPYTYSWSNGATTSSVSITTSGIYSVTVTDGDGFTATATANITVLSATVTATNISCNGGNNGSAAANPNGGTSPYTYSWSNSQTNQTANHLTLGTYTVTVKDNAGCTASALTTITQPTLLVTTASVTANATCYGDNNGSASSSASGGTSPYSYSWTGGGTNAVNSGITAGTYTITLTDNNSCTATAAVTVTQPTLLTVSATVTHNVSSCLLANGSVSSTASGGTSPYAYSWSNGGTNTSESALSAGGYTITVTDHNSCTASASCTVTEPGGLTVTANTTANELCNGESTGSASSSISGGTSPYTYSWSNGATSSTLSNLSTGTYTLTVTDNGGCVQTASTAITQPSALIVSGSQLAAVKCNGENDGSASSSVSGGTSPYTYSWSNASTTLTASNLSAGTFTLTVTDHNSCTASASATVTQPSALSVSGSQLAAVKCHGESDGSASSSVSGGTSPYTYSWSSGSTTLTVSDLSAGTYTISVKDANSCTETASATITQPAALTASVTVTSSSANCMGSAMVTGSGGTSPYTYAWSAHNGTYDTINHLCNGTYTCTVTDNNGCTSTAFEILTGVAVQNITDNSASVNIYPNPTTGQFTIQWSVGTNNYSPAQWSVEVYNVLGEKVYSKSTINNSQFTINLGEQANGVYMVRILNSDGSLVTQQKIVKTQ